MKKTKAISSRKTNFVPRIHPPKLLHSIVVVEVKKVALVFKSLKSNYIEKKRHFESDLCANEIKDLENEMTLKQIPLNIQTERTEKVGKKGAKRK